MAAKKRTRARKPKKPEGEIAASATLNKLDYILEAGQLKIDKKKLKYFIDQKLAGFKKPTVRFVARNAPFMRQPPVASV
jgi:hypothetical protein